MGNWLDNRISKDMENPKFRKAWEKWEPEDKVIRFMLDNDIEITQEFLDVLDELTEKGMTFALIPIEKKQKVKEPEEEPALA